VEKIGQRLLHYGRRGTQHCTCRLLTVVGIDGSHQLRAAMDATRRHDGKRIMLKKVFSEEGPHELRIAQLFSSREVARDPRNHCAPLLDVIELPNTDQKLMVMPFLRPFNNPRFQTFGEFVSFFMQVCEVNFLTCCRRRPILSALD
jgi:hypothetical protein